MLTLPIAHPMRLILVFMGLVSVMILIVIMVFLLMQDAMIFFGMAYIKLFFIE